MRTEMKQLAGSIGLLIVTLIWGGGFVATDYALESFSAPQVVAFRFTIAAVFMAVLAGKKLKTLTRDELKCGALLALALFGGFMLQTLAMERTTSSKAAFLTTTYVAFTPVVAFLIARIRVSGREGLAVVLAVVGAALMSLTAALTVGFGDILALLCAVAFSLQIYLTSRYVERIRPSLLNFLQMSGTAVLAWLVLLLTVGASGGNASLFPADPSLKSLLALIYLGMVSTGVCYIIQTWCQQFVPETRTAIILSLESVFGSIFSVILLGDVMTFRMILGGAMIFAAALISSLPAGEKKTKNPERK